MTMVSSIWGLEFAHPLVLVLLAALLPLAIWLLKPGLRKKRTPIFVFPGAHRLAARHRGLRVYLPPLLDVLFLAGLALVIIAMARPQVVDHEETAVEGIDIFIAFDMSGSMRAIDRTAEEVRAMEQRGETPQTRFEEAKQTLLDFVASRDHDRIGVVLFAVDAFLQVPLTLDHELIREQIAPLELGDIEEGGTAIGNAVGRALAGLEHSDTDTRIVILITDGDRRGGNISPMKAADMARQMGVKIYPILVGAEGEALIATGQNPFTRQTTYRPVEFPIDPVLLQNMADRTEGRYFRALDARSMREDLHEILDEYDRSHLEERGRTRHYERYGPFVLIAFLLFGVHFLVRHVACRQFP